MAPKEVIENWILRKKEPEPTPQKTLKSLIDAHAWNVLEINEKYAKENNLTATEISAILCWMASDMTHAQIQKRFNLK